MEYLEKIQGSPLFGITPRLIVTAVFMIFSPSNTACPTPQQSDLRFLFMIHYLPFINMNPILQIWFIAFLFFSRFAYGNNGKWNDG